MLCKKFYISIRIYGFLISQVLFPVFFVILGNVIAALGTRDAGQDPPRTLSLQTSALFANNITLFHAQFGSLGVVNSNELFSVSWTCTPCCVYTNISGTLQCYAFLLYVYLYKSTVTNMSRPKGGEGASDSHIVVHSSV